MQTESGSESDMEVTPKGLRQRKTGDAGDSPKTPQQNISAAMPSVETPNVVKRLTIHPSMEAAFQDFAKKVLACILNNLSLCLFKCNQ